MECSHGQRPWFLHRFDPDLIEMGGKAQKFSVDFHEMKVYHLLIIHDQFKMIILKSPCIFQCNFVLIWKSWTCSIFFMKISFEIIRHYCLVLATTKNYIYFYVNISLFNRTVYYLFIFSLFKVDIKNYKSEKKYS